MRHLLNTISLLLLAGLTLSACTPVTAAMGVGATVGVAAAQEGGIKTAVIDKAIYIKINDLWAHNSFEMFRKLDLNVKEGRVLIASAVPSDQHAAFLDVQVKLAEH